MDIAKFCTSAEKYPPPPAANGAGGPMQFSYGTAGFRTKGDLLTSTVFRCGALAAVRSHVTGRATGIVITASHNPEPDNGVKLVDCTGGMLPVSWESHAEALANADGPDAMKAVLEALMTTKTSAAADLDLHPPPPPGVPADPAPPHVFLARDTRPTGPDLAAAAKAGAEAIAGDGSVTDFGLMTTPQLHYLVYAAYRGMPHAESDYFARLASGFRTLVAATTTTTTSASGTGGGGGGGGDIAVDCANGVGASKLATLAAAVGADTLPLSLRNTEGVPGSLNNKVGADFVQKEVIAPRDGGFDSLPPGHRCVSVDGDSDRLVYFTKKEQTSTTTPGNNNDVTLFDGDKIASLMATHVADLLKRCHVSLSPAPSVGVVQTAYANGASTAYVSEKLGLQTACTPTGVKHLHPKAEEYDVGIYFEANGHGTAVFSDAAVAAIDEALAKTKTKSTTTSSSAAAAATADAADEDVAVVVDADVVAALSELKALTEAINPAVGDALSGILVVEAVLRSKCWGLKEWDAMYEDLPSRQVKVSVADRTVITTTDAERRAVTPAGMQEAIDTAVEAAGPSARAFARPSGTEDVVRVYAEAKTREGADALAREVARAVYTHAGGVGDAP